MRWGGWRFGGPEGVCASADGGAEVHRGALGGLSGSDLSSAKDFSMDLKSSLYEWKQARLRAGGLDQLRRPCGRAGRP